MMRFIALSVLLFGCQTSTTGTVYFATTDRVSRTEAVRACASLDGRLATLEDVDAIVATCADSEDSGPCWVDLPSDAFDYVVTVDAIVHPVPHGFGVALAICEVR